MKLLYLFFLFVFLPAILFPQVKIKEQININPEINREINGWWINGCYYPEEYDDIDSNYTFRFNPAQIEPGESTILQLGYWLYGQWHNYAEDEEGFLSRTFTITSNVGTISYFKPDLGEYLYTAPTDISIGDTIKFRYVSYVWFCVMKNKINQDTTYNLREDCNCLYGGFTIKKNIAKAEIQIWLR